MQNLTLALRARGSEGEPLASPFTSLNRMKSYHCRGQISLVAAAPGGGKSAYATHLAIQNRCPTLYFSADSDRLVLGSRAMAGILNIPLDDAANAIRNYDDLAMEELENSTDHIWWDFNPSPSIRDIEEEVQAYASVYGEYPHLVVVDNLMDVVGDVDDSVKYKETISFLQSLARETRAHVLILHHVMGAYENGNIPIPLSGLLQKVGKKPRLVLTIYKNQPGIMNICIVKNSTGPADAGGGLQVPIAWLPERSFFGE